MKLVKRWISKIISEFDAIYIRLDKKSVLRNSNLQLVPGLLGRKGVGKDSYGEWCHIIGIFQTLLCIHLTKKKGNRILDIGCGQGLLAIASQSFIQDGGKYLGVDVVKKTINFCKKHYPEEIYLFMHLDIQNKRYAPSQQKDEKKKWEVESGSIDAVTALSVWTHLNEGDAIFYFEEIDRVLKPGGIAMITFFTLDQSYHEGLSLRSSKIGKYHQTAQNLWIFDQRCEGSTNWFYPCWVRNEEDAIGISVNGIETMIAKTNLQIERTYPGNWKENPGVFFQDVIIFKKST